MNVKKRNSNLYLVYFMVLTLNGNSEYYARMKKKKGLFRRKENRFLARTRTIQKSEPEIKLPNFAPYDPPLVLSYHLI